MKILSNSTDIPNAEIRAIIRAVRPAGISNFGVAVTNCSNSWRGYMVGNRIMVRVNRTDRGARSVVGARGGYLPMATGSRREALVVIIAHELRHIWQRTHSRGHVWGSRGRFSERDADAYALQMLRRYRRGELDLRVDEPLAQAARPAPRSPEAERAAEAERVRASLKRWNTKAKRAATAIKKLTRKLRRLEKSS